MGNTKNDDKPSIIDELVDSLEDALEERKIKQDRRKAVDPNSPYTAPNMDRRKGVDRRNEKDKK